MRTPLKLFTRDAETEVLLHPEYSDFAYSDGAATERHIFDSLKTTVDRSCNSTELQAKIVDWATEYHFTPVRHNLLRHLDFHPGLQVLELGAGCGAITRQLGETGATITAIEGSLARARIASERCRDLPNVNVHCSDFNKVALEPVYDVVTLIGVLEYAPIFTDTSDPIVDALRFARSALKPGGRLIVAIENQLGLKYFCGATEDHLAKQYFGLEDRYTARSVRTLGRQELHTKFMDAGFTAIEFQYPFPDYKLPCAVIFEQAFTQSDFLPDEIVRHIYARDYSGKGQDNIDASMVWPVLARNGLMREMANSFLIIASEESPTSGSTDTQTLALTYTNDRANQYNTITEFVRKQDNQIATIKRKLDPFELTSNDVISQDLHETPYIWARTLHSELLAATKRGEMPLVTAHLIAWIKYLSSHATDPGTTTWTTSMPPNFIDCTPFNLLVADRGFHHIDQEWAYKREFSLGSLVLRYLNRYGSEPAAAKLFGVTDKHPGRRVETIRRVLLHIGLAPNDRSYQDFIFLQNEIDSVVFPNKPKYTDNLLSKALAMPDIDVNRHIKNDDPHTRNPLIAECVRRVGIASKDFYRRNIGWRFR